MKKPSLNVEENSESQAPSLKHSNLIKKSDKLKIQTYLI